MTESDFGPFIERLTRLAGLLDAPLASERIAGYVEALQDLRLDDLLVAVSRAGRECTFFPKPVEIRAFALDAARARQDAESDAVLAALPPPAPITPEERQRTEEAFQRFMAQARLVLQHKAFPEAPTGMR